MTHTHSVPPAYRGVWRRQSFVGRDASGAAVNDVTTRVIWLQTEHWHADLRVPAERPAFAATDLASAPTDALRWIAGQTAFAGLTRVEGCYCSWHRLHDLSPTLDRDVGVMHSIDADTLEERHPNGDYIERWQRLCTATAQNTVQIIDAALTPRWLSVGDHAIEIIPREQLPDGHDLLAPPAQLDDDALRRRASLSLSYARRTPDGWRIELSTLPWREGTLIRPPE